MCNWQGFSDLGYYYATNAPIGALMVWIDKGEKQNAGIVKGPGRVYFSPSIGGWITGDRKGELRVKLIPIANDE